MSTERSFGKRLRELRKDQGLTQERLAEKAGLEYKYIQMLEGKTPPSPTLRTIQKLARALNLSLHDLVPYDTKGRYLKAAEKKKSR